MFTPAGGTGRPLPDSRMCSRTAHVPKSRVTSPQPAGSSRFMSRPDQAQRLVMPVKSSAGEKCSIEHLQVEPYSDTWQLLYPKPRMGHKDDT